MTTPPPLTCTTLSDAELVAHATRLAAGERHATVQLIVALMEIDARRLYLAQGCSSLFTLCVQVLHLSEHAAYGRIEAARAARRFPVILDCLAEGSLTLTTAGLLAPHLTPDNHGEVIDAARHKTKREVEHLVARLRPQPPVAATIRKLPARVPPPAPPVLSAAPAARAVAAASAASDPDITPTPSTSPGAAVSTALAAPTAPPLPALRPADPCPPPAPRPVVVPLAPEIYKVQVTLGRETVDKLRRLQDLMRHAIPDGDLAVIFDRALTLLLADVERSKLAAAAAPRKARPSRPGSRHIPAHVRRTVWARDEGRCTFVGPAGRCAERGFLEFHHLDPYALGGEAAVQTIALRCLAHNQYAAELDFGPCVPRRGRRDAPTLLDSAP